MADAPLRRAVWDRLRRISDDPAAAEAEWRALFAPDIAWHGPHPIDDQRGAEAVLAGFWRPLVRAMPDVERRDDLFLGGTFDGGTWIAASGHWVGTFARPLFDIPATGRLAALRYGEFYRLDGERVVESYVILDFPGLMHQAGVWPLPRSLGVELLIPGPATRDGVRLAPGGAAAARASLDLVEAMIAGLMRFDGADLGSMRMQDFWDPRFNWYGPAGIGSTRGLVGFQDGHQRPFLTAFPDRVGGDHKCRIGDGAYVASTGWPSVRATHSGPDFLGLTPTGKRISMRVMDFWRRDGDRLAENWVFIDLIDLVRQMGIDLFDRMRRQYKIDRV